MKMKKRLRLSTITVFFAMLLGFAVMFIGTEQACAMEGDGSEENPYEISNYIELKDFANLVNEGYTDACAILKKDIVCTDKTWVPIASDAESYTGTFDGNNKKITKLSNEESVEIDSAMFQGLFGKVGYGATVKDVGLVDADIHGNGNIGGVAGWNEGIITNCYIEGNVSGKRDAVGGVAGHNGGTITNCCSAGNVSGNGRVGGVAGENRGGAITNCCNTGDVSESNNTAGGVSGLNNGTITSCYNTGNVNGSSLNVGGVAGWNNRTITNCYNTGDVSGNVRVGGVAGFIQGTMTNCYNTGRVSGNEGVGGVAGWDFSGGITNCYYDSTTSGVNSAIGDTDDTENVKGLETDKMTGKNALDNMVFEYNGSETNPWMVKENDDYAKYYPHLKGFNLDEDGSQMTAANISTYEWPARIDLIVATPTFSPEDRIFYPKQSIRISCATKGATIYYTTDGTDPTTSDNEYTEPIVITDTTTIKAIAVKEGAKDSDIAVATYTKTQRDGSAKNPYKITNYAELKEFANLVNDGYTDACAILTDDIVCADKTWVPIATEAEPYTGTFDGNNKKIENLSNTERAGAASANSQGLFGETGSKATVKNVGLAAIYIHGNSNIGGVAGYNKGTITNCYSTGNVSGSGSNVGGVAGQSRGTITNCYNTGDVSGNNGVGGVAGFNERGTITNCYNTGKVSKNNEVSGVVGNNDFGENNEVGGVAGNNKRGTIINCYYDSDTSGVKDAVGNSTYDSTSENVKGLKTKDMTGTDCTAYDSWDDFYAIWKLTDDYPILDPHDHKLIYAKEQSCVEPAHAEGYTCKVCDKHYSDTDGKTLISDKDWKISPTGHDWNETTCTEPKTCRKCDAVGDPPGHRYGAWTKLDASRHQRVCERDKTHVEKADHTWDAGKVTKPATTTATGIKIFTCSDCKATRTETIAKLPEYVDPDDPENPKKQDDPEDPKKPEDPKDPKKPEDPKDPEKQYGTDGTPVGPGASIEAAEKAITNTTSDKDIKGTTFAPLKFMSSSQGKTNIKLSWTKDKKAAKYVVYGNLCNKGSKKYKPVKIAAVNGRAISIKKIGSAKLRKGTYYKFIIVAIDKNNKVVSTSKTIHVTTKGGKTGNYKSVTIKAKVNAKGKAIKKAKPISKTVLKKGKSLKLTVKMNPAGKKVKVKKHAGLRYETTNAKIATVSGNKIKAKGKGKCIIYAYAQNGVYKKLKVTVK